MAVQLPAPVPIGLDLSMDLRVLVFTTLLAVVATMAFGMAPAISASKIDLVTTLKGIGAGGLRHGRLRAAFLVAQVSMSVLLLVVAGLFIRGFRNAQSIDIGFETAHVLTASVDLETRGYSQARAVQFMRSLTERLEAVPGIVSANVVDIVPVTLSNSASHMLRDSDVDPGRDQPPPTPLIYMNAVGPGHFKTLEIAMLAGRDFTHLDMDGAPRVAIVNETLARQFWSGQNAVGQRLRPLGTDTCEVVQVAGVVRDSKYVTVGEAPRPFIYRPLAQVYTPRITLLVRAAGAPGSVLPAIKQVVRALDPGLPVFNVATLAEATSLSLLPARIAGALLGALGLLALELAPIH